MSESIDILDDEKLQAALDKKAFQVDFFVKEVAQQIADDYQLKPGDYPALTLLASMLVFRHASRYTLLVAESLVAAFDEQTLDEITSDMVNMLADSEKEVRQRLRGEAH